jgi:GNAT superfamily N-acetyltransferase
VTADQLTQATDALTADGGIVRLRSVNPDDAAGLTDLYRRGSADNLRLRFFSNPGERALENEIDRLVRDPAGDHEVVVAEHADALIGVASYERLDDRPSTGEFAIYVDDAHHGEGVGTLLLEHLAARARRHGITELVGEVLPTNAGMLKVAKDLTGHTTLQFDEGVVDVRVRTTLDQEALAVADARDRVAATASCDRCSRRGWSPWSGPGAVPVASATRRCSRWWSSASPASCSR